MSDPRADLQNPSTTPQRLAEIASSNPELSAEIAAHPNVYPELKQWLDQYASPAPSAPADAAQAPADAQPTTPLTQAPADAQPTTPLSGMPQDQQATQQLNQTGQQTPYGPPAGAGQAQPGQPATAGQPGQAPQQFAAGAAAAGAAGAAGTPPQGPGGYPAAPAGGNGKGKGKKKTVLIVSIAAALVVLLGAGGGVWWWLSNKLGGAKTPEAATEQIIESATTLDPVGLYGVLAPSEFASFRPAFENAMELSSEKDGETFQEAMDTLKNEVSVEVTTPLEIESDAMVTEDEQDLISRTTVTDGVIEFDGDPEVVADAIMTFAEPAIEQSADMYGEDASDAIDDARDELEDTLKDEMPYELDFSDLDEDFTMVTVFEEGAWYVSPLMTIADYAYLEADPSDYDLGTKIVKGSGKAKSPEQAAENLTDTLVDGTVEEIAAEMPLAERRLLSVYAGPYLDQSISDAYNEAMYGEDWEEYFGDDDAGFEITDKKFSAKEDGDTARISIEKLVFEMTQLDYWTNQESTSTAEVSDTCVTLTTQVPVKNDKYDDLLDEYYDFEKDNWLKYDTFEDFLEAKGESAYDMEESTDDLCLDDIAGMKELGVDDWKLVAVEEDGAWYVSPLGTLADISVTVSNNIQELIDDGKLDDLFEDLEDESF